MKLPQVPASRSKAQWRARPPRGPLDFERWTLDLGMNDRGVALVITLIMLSVITFLAITFLVLSQRERGSVTTTTDSKVSRMASDTALNRVCAELITQMNLHTNLQDFDLRVSTNYINYSGFVDGLSPSNPRNVNYDHETNQISFGGGAAEWARNISDLFYNPRAPVFVQTNALTGQYDFRFYIDLNRNGRPDTNGSWPLISGNPAFPYFTTNIFGQLTNVPSTFTGFIVTNNFIGDPEWIGVLERPAELHSADNRFIARYAYLVVPVGKTLDINTLHNQAMTRTVNPAAGANDGFFRNQGTGPWEINMAAFLVDLNTNIWDANPNTPANYYQYNQANPIPGNNLGVAFDDARAILSYRYANNYATLNSAGVIFPNLTVRNDNIDEYSDGPLMTNIFNIDETLPGFQDVAGRPWAGADNTNHYFTTQDLFDSTKTGTGFNGRLQQVSGSNDSYNAYTFYRLLAQMGTDSPTDSRMNINYKNMVNGKVVPGMETNLISWTPLDFFTNAVAAMFKQLNLTDLNGHLITVTNIPVYEDPTIYNGTNINYYTPAVHRILQLAANIYDATTNQTVPVVSGQTNAFFPSVFRPYFSSQNGVVYISGFVEETTATGPGAGLSLPFLTSANFSKAPQTDNVGVNIYGVPWVIGAKKGYPNFNYYAVSPQVSLTRKLRLTRVHDGDPLTIQQMYNLSITNQLTVQGWNSYANDWPMAARPLVVSATNDYTLRVVNTITNPITDELSPPDIREFTSSFTTNLWRGFNPLFSPARSIITPVAVTYPIMGGSSPGTNAYSYFSSGPRFLRGTNYESTTIPVPQWYIVTTNRLRYAMVDTSANRVVDFVNLEESPKVFDLTQAITNNADCGDLFNANSVWCAQPMHNTPFRPYSDLAPGTQLSMGIDAQIDISMGNEPSVYSPTNGAFQQFAMGTKAGTNETPYNPTWTTNFVTCWQANDPLVHYTTGDLTDLKQDPTKVVFPQTTFNHHYQPWDGPNVSPSDSSQNIQISAAKKDPSIKGSDSWLFLTNKFPNLGWLGRVHRGTPWQTVYMKSPIINLNDWVTWTGDTMTNGTAVDAGFSQPLADYQLFDLFTTGINENSSHGQLNVNQTNLAAWSAVLSGVNVLTNFNNGTVSSTNISPAGVYSSLPPYPPLVQIWQGINNARASTNLQNQTFQHIGDVLATPQLTVASPFINTNNSTSPPRDEVLERIPQQIMSLLTLNQTPRFVIYSFGQTLHPADHSLVIGGPFNGLCTNYQITAETATRAVVRVEGSPKDPTHPPHVVVEQFNVLPPD